MTELKGWRTKTLEQKAKLAADLCYALWEFFVVKKPSLAEDLYFNVGTFSMIATVQNFLGADREEWEDLVDRTLTAIEGKLHQVEKIQQIKEYEDAH